MDHQNREKILQTDFLPIFPIYRFQAMVSSATSILLFIPIPLKCPTRRGKTTKHETFIGPGIFEQIPASRGEAQWPHLLFLWLDRVLDENYGYTWPIGHIDPKETVQEVK